MPTDSRGNSQDSLNLIKYYPKPKVSSYEILFGLNTASIRGIVKASQYVGGGNSYDILTPTNKIGLAFGVGIIHDFNKRLEITARALFERKGIFQTIDSVTVSSSGAILSSSTLATHDSNIDYVTSSVIPRIKLGRHSQFRVGLGVYFGIIYNSRVKHTYFHPPQHIVSDKGAYEKNDFGLLINASYEFSISRKMKLVVQSSYCYGLRQISIWHAHNSSFPTLYNSSYSIMIGVKLPNDKTKL